MLIVYALLFIYAVLIAAYVLLEYMAKKHMRDESQQRDTNESV